MSSRDASGASHFVVRSVVGRAGPIFSHVMAVRRHVRMQHLAKVAGDTSGSNNGGSNRADDKLTRPPPHRHAAFSGVTSCAHGDAAASTTETATAAAGAHATSTTTAAMCVWDAVEQVHVRDCDDASSDDDVCVHLVAYVHPALPPPPAQYARTAAALAKSTGLPLRVQPPALKTYAQATRDDVRRGYVPVAAVRMHRDAAVSSLTAVLGGHAYIVMLDRLCVMADQCDDCVTNALVAAAEDIARRALYATHVALYATPARQRVCAAFGYLVVPPALVTACSGNNNNNNNSHASTEDGNEAAVVAREGASSACDCALMVKELSQLSALGSAHL